MPRIKFRKQLQAKFLFSIQKELRLSWPQLAKILRVHPRSLSDWRREKYTLPEKVFKKGIKLTKYKIKIPPCKVLPDFWSVEKASRKGGFSRNKMYGNPGTPEGRRKGGLVSQQRRRLHPELYQHCNLRKNIFKPRNSTELAEFFGIIMGDGGINSDYQVVITLHKENDKKYISFVSKLIKKLFGIKPAVYHYRSLRSQKVVGITISSASIVEFLLRKGLKKGNKIKQQIGVPDWIKNNIEFSKSCLRGLIDTDGGVFYHRHKAHGYECFNIGLQFTSKSIPILEFVYTTFEKLGFTPKLNKRSVNLYREQEVYRYPKEIGFNNSYHTERLKIFSKKKAIFLRRSVPNW